MEDDGFTLVTGKKAARHCGHRNQRPRKKAPVRVDGAEKDIEKALEEGGAGIVKSGLGRWLEQKLENLVEERKIRKIYLVGNGNFDFSHEPGAHQLALFLDISRKFDAEIVFQEPECSKAEYEWLKANNVTFRESRSTEISMGSGSDDFTVLAMIHGEHDVLNGILKHNWEDLKKKNKLIVIGNDYGRCDWEMNVLRPKFTLIDEFFQKSRVDYFPAVYEPHRFAFHGTVIMSPLDFDKDC